MRRQEIQEQDSKILQNFQFQVNLLGWSKSPLWEWSPNLWNLLSQETEWPLLVTLTNSLTKGRTFSNRGIWRPVAIIMWLHNVHPPNTGNSQSSGTQYAQICVCEHTPFSACLWERKILIRGRKEWFALQLSGPHSYKTLYRYSAHTDTHTL